MAERESLNPVDISGLVVSSQRWMEVHGKTLTEDKLRLVIEEFQQKETILTAFGKQQPYAVVVGDINYKYSFPEDPFAQTIVSRGPTEPISLTDWEFATLFIEGEAVPFKKVVEQMLYRGEEYRLLSNRRTEPTDAAVKQHAAAMLGLAYEPIFQGQNPPHLNVKTQQRVNSKDRPPIKALPYWVRAAVGFARPLQTRI